MQTQIEPHITREDFFRIKKAVHNGTDWAVIAERHKVPVELVEDIAASRRFSWIFKGVKI